MGRLILIEARLLARERRAWAVLALLALAAALAAVTGHGLLEQQLEGRRIAAAGDPAGLARVAAALRPGADPAMAVLLPYWIRDEAVSPPPPLADFSAGRAMFEPHATTLTLRARPDTLFQRTAVDNPEATTRGLLDLGFLAVVLAPLALIALGYGLFTADRDSGAARLLLVQGGSPARLLLARSVPRLALVAAPIALAALALLAFGPAIEGRAAAAAWWLAIAAAFLAFWWAAILAVNALRIGAETAALALVALWALTTLVLPAAIAAGAQLAFPPPSRFQQIAEARAAEIAATSAWETDHPELAAEGFAGRLASVRKTLGIARTVERAVAPLDARFDAQLAGQQRLVRALAWIAPPLAAADAMTAVAGTDAGRALGFRRAAAAQLAGLKARLGGFIDRGAVMTAAEHDALPRFAWRPEPARPIGLVAFLAAAAALLTALALRRLSRRPI